MLRHCFTESWLSDNETLRFEFLHCLLRVQVGQRTKEIVKMIFLKKYREREAYAAEVARQIEGNVSSRNAIELENGDEEEAFSAVVRPHRGKLFL